MLLPVVTSPGGGRLRSPEGENDIRPRLARSDTRRRLAPYDWPRSQDSVSDKEPNVHDLLFRPASELAALVRSGEITARELVSASLERIDALDGQINAFTHVDAEGALAAADAIGQGDERPF